VTRPRARCRRMRRSRGNRSRPRQEEGDCLEVEGAPDARSDNGEQLSQGLVRDEQLGQLEELARVGRASRRVASQLLQSGHDDRDQKDDCDVDDERQPVLPAATVRVP